MKTPQTTNQEPMFQFCGDLEEQINEALKEVWLKAIQNAQINNVQKVHP